VGSFHSIVDIGLGQFENLFLLKAYRILVSGPPVTLLINRLLPKKGKIALCQSFNYFLKGLAPGVKTASSLSGDDTG
jgi:hypothetical protein